MANELEPRVDQWYSRRDKGEMFRVVALDDSAIEIQNFDGDIEELDREAWQDLNIAPAEPPENWTGPFDDIEADDLGDTENATRTGDWRAPLEPLPSESEPLPGEEEPWQDTRPSDLRDEDEEGRPVDAYTAEEQPAGRSWRGL